MSPARHQQRLRCFFGPLVLVFLATATAHAQTRDSAGSTRAIAITFDDVPGMPVAGDCDRESSLDLNRRLVTATSMSGVPATGFVTASRICDSLRDGVLPEVFDLWLAAGFGLGNHSFSHPDLNRTSVAAYVADIVRGEAPLDSVLASRGARIRYFRYPQLHAGDDTDKKQAVEDFLVGRGYENAPVTIDSQEWVFAGAFRNALAAGNEEAARCIGQAYVPFMEQVVEFFESWSAEVLGYEPPQILLLHDNELNARYVPQLVDMLRRRGYRFISLSEALADSAYGHREEYVGPRGLSWIHRWALARGMTLREEPRDPPWVAELNGSGARFDAASWTCPAG